MKKKAIERIPYIGLKKNIRPKSVKYIGITAIRIVGHEKHLFLEVYRNAKKQTEPVVRVVLNKKEFGTYIPETGEWNRRQIMPDEYYDAYFIWNTPGERGCTQKELEKQNILQSPEDLERIKKFCKGVEVWDNHKWWKYIYRYEQNISITARRKAEDRRYERRQNALNDRISHTKELPEKEILETADNLYFHHAHYLYYKKRGCFAQIACSKCGGVTTARWKAGISFESQFQCFIEEPREGQTGTCPLCGAHGEYKCQGKVKGYHSKSIHLFLGQKYKECGMVLRYMEVTKAWRLGLIEGKNGTEMFNSSEELSGVEIARAYFEPGKKLQIDYHKHNWYDGKDFWDDCNLYGNANITIGEAPILKETYQEMEGTIFQYSALKEYTAAVREAVNPISYFERYQQTPQIEVLVKLGLIGVVKELIRYRYGIVTDQDARRPDKFLGIRKESVKQLIAAEGDPGILNTMQMEKRMQQVWTGEQIEHLTETGLGRGQIETAIRYMSLQKLLNRIEKYSGCEYGTKCSGAEQKIRSTATTYADYLNMRQSLGYDLNNTIYQHPRDLETAHDEMVRESHKEEIDKRLNEVAIRFPDIQSRYRELRKKYFYEDDEYLIRPARSAEEIVMEGRTLHHCVGGDTYLRRHDRGESYILMLRDKEQPDRPYITVEIDSQKPYIKQWYGTHDRKPDERNMQRWLDEYLLQLENQTPLIRTRTA
jgi:hypothetical protein|nr:MAG TPA: PcfJ like protein [Caudoviricetes sp.]